MSNTLAPAPAIVRLPVLKHGLHQAASDAFRRAGIDASRIGQTVGYAEASAGAHAPDGTYTGTDNEEHVYTAATDLRIADLSNSQVWDLLGRLSQWGFAAFYRSPGHDHWPLSDARHVHAVYAGCPMKPMLQHQVHDYLHLPTLNGLASHAEYQFFQPSKYAQGVIRTLFLAHNPAG